MIRWTPAALLAALALAAPIFWTLAVLYVALAAEREIAGRYP